MDRAPLPNLPLEKPTGGYVGSAACQSCHPNQHGSWHESYHRTMTQVATEESVVGDFNNVRLSGKDLDVRLFKEDGRFKVEMSLNHSPTTRVYTVVMTTGSHIRQAYWLADPPDRELMLLPYMYLRAEQRWIPRPSGYITKNGQADSSELAAFRSEKGRWSQVCIRCHTTHGQANPIDQSLATPRVAELGISCEACHGPGAAHIEATRRPDAGQEALTSIVNPAKLPHDRSAQVCGQCHTVFLPRSEAAGGYWQMNGNTFRPGDDLLADRIFYVVRGRLDLMPDRPAHIPDPVETGSFWSDGMIRVTGREFSGLIETPCYQRGSMSCLSCHEMHQDNGDPRPPAEWAAGQLKPGMDGNLACVQCHKEFDDAAVVAQHSHHKADSSGSRCYNCHMPHTTYGLLKATRSHMVHSPRVADSLQTGRPNACNLCHLDQTLAWTAEKLALWYQQPLPKLPADEANIAASVLWALRGDAGQRALTAWSFGWADAHQASGNNWQAPFLGQLLDDRYNAVRFIAHRSLRRLPGFGDFDYDFVGAPAIRSAAVVNARKVWQQSQDGQKRPFAPQTLIDPTGHIREADFQRLLRRRDDRPIEFAE
ncbi:MAG: C cytochrome precursor [Planctomycetes bacterium]|nr:C cytochrome precursor [Planctomycetota bacterium]